MLRNRSDKQKVFCGPECLDEHNRRVRLEKREARKIPCGHCATPFVPYEGARFCSRECASASRRKFYDRVCQNCGKAFQVANIHEIKRGDHKYCSLECNKRKWRFVEVDFGRQSSETAYWLGFMFATVVSVDETDITLEADESSLAEFNRFVSGNMVPVPSQGGHRLVLYSRPFSRKMRLLGLRDDLYMEAPPLARPFVMDFVRGFMDSPSGFIYRDGGELVAALHGSNSKLMRWLADMTGGTLAYKDKEWIVVARGLPSACDGLPRNEAKWARITAGAALL